MMDLNNLSPIKGSKRTRKRVGRGNASGWGKTAGKGHKGQNARSGASVPASFEGGQMPLHRRLPKRGFSNWAFRKRYALVNLRDLARFEADGVVDPGALVGAGLVKKLYDGVKVLGDGEISVALTVRAHRFSKSAIAKIEAAGGKAEIVGSAE
jgi:large subunit ribosomal protein L15